MCMYWLVVDHIWGEHKMAGTRWQPPTQLRPTPTMMIKWWSMSSEKNAFGIFEILHLGNTIVNCSMRWAECVLLCLVVVDESFQRRQPFLFYIIQPGRAWRLTEATKYTACQFCLEASCQLFKVTFTRFYFHSHFQLCATFINFGENF